MQGGVRSGKARRATRLLLPHRVAASTAWGCSFYNMGLQPRAHGHMGLQPPLTALADAVKSLLSGLAGRLPDRCTWTPGVTPHAVVRFTTAGTRCGSGSARKSSSSVSDAAPS